MLIKKDNVFERKNDIILGFLKENILFLLYIILFPLLVTIFIKTGNLKNLIYFNYDLSLIEKISYLDFIKIVDHVNNIFVFIFGIFFIFSVIGYYNLRNKDFLVKIIKEDFFKYFPFLILKLSILISIKFIDNTDIEFNKFFSMVIFFFSTLCFLRYKSEFKNIVSSYLFAILYLIFIFIFVFLYTYISINLDKDLIIYLITLDILLSLILYIILKIVRFFIGFKLKKYIKYFLIFNVILINLILILLTFRIDINDNAQSLISVCNIFVLLVLFLNIFKKNNNKIFLRIFLFKLNFLCITNIIIFILNLYTEINLEFFINNIFIVFFSFILIYCFIELNSTEYENKEILKKINYLFNNEINRKLEIDLNMKYNINNHKFYCDFIYYLNLLLDYSKNINNKNSLINYYKLLLLLTTENKDYIEKETIYMNSDIKNISEQIKFYGGKNILFDILEIKKLDEIINKDKINENLFFFEYIFPLNLYSLLSKEETDELYFRGTGDSEILEFLKKLENIKK